jgi:hypothetical protein
MRTHSETITMTFHSMVECRMVLKNSIGTEFATFEFKTMDKRKAQAGHGKDL